MLLQLEEVVHDGQLTTLTLRGDRIAALGQPCPDGAQVIQAGGAHLFPGLWDTHIHLLWWADALAQLDLRFCRGAADLLQAVAQRAALSAPQDWIVGHGWNECHWSDSTLPTLSQLDEAAAGRPLYLSRSDLHSGLANTAALQLADIAPERPDPAGGKIGRDSQGRLDGRLYDLALDLILRSIPEPPEERRLEQLRQATRRLHALGITGVCDQRIKDQNDGPLARRLYRHLRGLLRIHCNLAAHEMGPHLDPFLSGDEWLRQGHVKFFADGSLGSLTARMRLPYLGSDHQRGLWLTPPEELRRGFAQARQLGFPISCHAIGDEAIGAVLDALATLEPHPLDRIEHLQILAEEDLQRCSRIPFVASMQPLHLVDDRTQADQLLGERARGYYRLQSLRRAGVQLSFGSDAPVADPDPWKGILAATQRRASLSETPWYPQEQIDWEAALQAYTRGAQRLGWKEWTGIEAGAPADFILLEGPPQRHDPTQTRVRETWIGGQRVWARDGLSQLA